MAKLSTENSSYPSLKHGEIYNPFPGLRSFESSESHLFFGREKQMAELLRKLRAKRFLAILGNSGSGKSSMVKCGLLPRLRKGFSAQAGSQWRIVQFKPGIDPIGNMSWELAAANAEAQGEMMEPNYPSQIEQILRSGTLGLVRLFEQSEMMSDENLVLVIDQFGEIFKFHEAQQQNDNGSNDALIFINLLLSAAHYNNLPIYIVITMRSDFLGNSTNFRGLPEIINDGQFLMPRMQRDEIKRAITGPLTYVKVPIMPQLVSRLLNELGDKLDELPILQHAMMRMFELWEEDADMETPISNSHYERIGTMSLALDMHAEEAYNELKSTRDQDICKRIFKIVTEKGIDGRGTSRPTKMKDIIALLNNEVHLDEVVDVLHPFVQTGRTFITLSDTDVDYDTIVSLSHESLMRVWGRLIKWVDEEKESAQIYLRLAHASVLYFAGKSGLWRNPELQLGLNWYKEQKPNRIWAKRYGHNFSDTISFLKESEMAYENELRLEKEERANKMMWSKRLNQISVAGILFFVVLAGFALWEGYNAMEAEKAALLASERATLAKEQAMTAAVKAQWQKIAAEEAEEKAEAKQIEANEAKIGMEKALEISRQKALELEEEQRKVMAETEQKEKALEEANKKTIELVEKQNELEKESKEKVQALKVSREKAEENRKLSLLSESQALAAKSQKMETPEVQSLLAEAAYIINDGENKEYDPFLYDGLYEAINFFDEKVNKRQEDFNIYSNIHNGAVNNVFSLNDRLMVTVGKDGNIYSWLKKNKGTPYTLAEGGVRLVNPKNNKKKSYHLAMLDHQKKWLASVTSRNKIELYQVNDLLTYVKGERIPDVLDLHNGSKITAISFHPDKKRILTVGKDKRLLSTNYLVKGNNITSKEIDGNLKSKINVLCVTPNGQYIFGGGDNGFLYKWDVNDETQPPIELEVTNNIPLTALAVTQNGKVIIGTEMGTIYTYQPGNKPILISDRHGSRVTSLKYGNTSNPLLISTSLDGTAKLWQPHKLNNKNYLPVQLSHSDWVMSADFFNEFTIITGSKNGEMKLFPTGTSQLSDQLCILLSEEGVSQDHLNELNRYIDITSDKYKGMSLDKKLEACYRKIK